MTLPVPAVPAGREMSLSKFITIRLFDPVIVSLTGIAYGVALFSTAIGGFWTGPDFDHPPMSGWECLLWGWLHFPIGWLANPLMFVAVILLLTRCRIVAFFLAAGAIGLAWLWTYDFSRQFSAKLLMAGYDWWVLSMQVLLVGVFCSLIVHYAETWRSMQSLGQSGGDPVPEVQGCGEPTA
jgi:hypothetical protein